MASVAAETAAAGAAAESAAAAQSSAEIAPRGYCGGRTFAEYLKDVRRGGGLENTISRRAYAPREASGSK